MRALTRLLVAGAVVAAALTSAASPVQAETTWDYANVTFAVADGFGSTGTVSVYHLRVTGSSATGYVGIGDGTGRYTCTTTSFTGLTANWFVGMFSPCQGRASFAVDQSGTLTLVDVAVTVASTFFTGTGTGSAQGTTWAMTCSATRTGPADVDVTWTDPGSGASGYEVASSPASPAAVSAVGTTTNVSGLARGTAYRFTISPVGGQALGSCTTDAVWTPPAAPRIDGRPNTVAVGGLMTVNYSLPDATGVQGIEYQIGNGPWLRPGGVAPLSGNGGSFTVRGLTSKDLTVTLRAVGDDAGGPLTTAGPSTPVSFEKAPTPAMPSSGAATGSASSAAVGSSPPAPVSAVAGTSNGAGTGTNGALAASSGDPGIDAPCLAQDGTLYPNQFSTVGSQLTMAPNTHGMRTVMRFRVVGGALAPGMQLDRTHGVLFGVTTQAGSYLTEVRVDYADGTSETNRFTTRVDADRQTLQYAARNVGVVGRVSALAPTTNASAVGTRYELVCGELPAGTRLDSATGVIAGRPTRPVEMPTPLRVASSGPSGQSAASFVFVVSRAGAASFSYPAHPHLRVGRRVVIRPTVTGPRDLVSFRTSRGRLPKGLHLNHRTGVFTGRSLHAFRAHTVTVVAVARDGGLVSAPPMMLRVRR